MKEMNDYSIYSYISLAFFIYPKKHIKYKAKIHHFINIKQCIWTWVVCIVIQELNKFIIRSNLCMLAEWMCVGR